MIMNIFAFMKSTKNQTSLECSACDFEPDTARGENDVHFGLGQKEETEM